MDELELLVQRVSLVKKTSLRVMNAFIWMWAVEKKGKILEEC